MQQHCCNGHHLLCLMCHGIYTLLCHSLLHFTHARSAACGRIVLQALVLMTPYSVFLHMHPYPCTLSNRRNAYIMSSACVNWGICLQGAGTVAHLMNHFWLGVKMEGWELDPKIYPVARDHMGLQQLEDSGALVGPRLGSALLVCADVCIKSHMLDACSLTLTHIESW